MARPRENFPALRVTGTRWRPLDDLYHFVLTRSWSQFLGFATTFYVSANALFALAYWAVPGSVRGVESYADAFYFSVQTFSTVGYGALSPATHWANMLVTVESMVGLLCMALLTGLTFARFSRPSARVRFAAKIVSHERDGVPHLVFRVANERHNNIVEAQLRVLLLLSTTTREGYEMRVPHELELVRDRTALFMLTWIPMHRIDERSPFFGGPASLERLREQKAELFLSLSGLDDTSAQTVHARCRYSLDDIAWDHTFADVLTIEPDGTRVLEYEKFDEIVPVKKKEAT
jgi:inward rectifier potassium channel